MTRARAKKKKKRKKKQQKHRLRNQMAADGNFKCHCSEAT